MSIFRSSIFLAALVAIAAAGWILSGQFDETATARQTESVAQAASEREVPRTRVRTFVSRAEPYTERLIATAATAAHRSAVIRAEIAGKVTRIDVEKGARVKAGASILRFDMGDLQSQLAGAEARLKQRRLEVKAARALAAKGFEASTRQARAEADLRAAEATLAAIRERIEKTRVTVPFAGIVNDRTAEIGDYIKIGNPVATLIDLDPIVVVADIPEKDFLKLQVGQVGQASLMDGRRLDGVIRYVARRADPATRTFRVELEAPNADLAWVAGATVRLVIALPPRPAHRLPPSILVLDKAGSLGVHVVDATDEVVFKPVTILGIRDNLAYVSGLPETAEVITVGQDFVTAGDLVDATTTTGAAAGLSQ
ncbi:MAG: efflux RND transporter periplasmic adaptor subunit [Pseudomonadota bacterium]|nr:efflux RND transporter periplasmic adaptor subunit [Pseudomonadota bacterium]